MVHENGDSNLGIPFRYWAIDLSVGACGDLMLLSRILRGEEIIHDVIASGKAPAKVVRVENFEYGHNFADYLHDEDARYIPWLPSSRLTDLYG